ncbi:unnamed protein product [Calicophoron daubneyi]|uniref:Uncharacterized protein n=1 Tax=Calicophoron daubneyi TaxID=300641 RepID=A0AAV2TEX5_CALDB
MRASVPDSTNDWPKMGQSILPNLRWDNVSIEKIIYFPANGTRPRTFSKFGFDFSPGVVDKNRLRLVTSRTGGMTRRPDLELGLSKTRLRRSGMICRLDLNTVI